MSHAEAIGLHDNSSVLLRCTTINLYVIDSLRAEDILDEEQDSDLRTEKNQRKQCRLLFQWLKEVSSDKYKSFLKVMKDTEQEHVANLLTGSTDEDLLPLSNARYTRLEKIRNKVAKVTRIDTEVIAELRILEAISETDGDEIRAETVDYEKTSKLISAIMRRSNHSYNSFQEVLRKTLQTAAADYLNEGEMPAVHINNSRSDLDGPLSLALNDVIKNKTPDDAKIKELLAEINRLGLNPVIAIPGESIVVFIYCKTVENAVKFTQIFNSGRLKHILEGILNRLLLTIEPHNTKTLDWRTNLEDDDVISLEEFTGIEGCVREIPTRPNPLDELRGCDANAPTDESPIVKKFKENVALEDCNICYHETAVRRELPCEHSLCLNCIENMTRKTGRIDHLSCPNCRGLFTMTVPPKDSVDQPQYVREKYKQEIKPAKDVGGIKHNEKIMGMAILGDELFIVCKSPPNVIFKYDIGAGNKGPWIPVQLSISEMKWPRGIAASETSSCLYITDWNKIFGGRLWRYKYQKGQTTRPKDPVAILDVQPFGVSVSKKTDQVLVTCATPVNIFDKRGWIYIYKPSGPDFLKIRMIELPDLEIPRHSILTPSSKFIVCHGWNIKSHGVTSYLYDGIEHIIKKSFYGKVSGGGSGEHEMNKPLSMIQDEDGLILVVDYYNHRIQLLTEDLQLVRHLITSGITYPRHICLHSKTGRIYVGQEDGNVQIFDARNVEERRK